MTIFALHKLKVAKASWNLFIGHIFAALSAVLCAVEYRPPVLHTDLSFEDLRLGSLLKPHTHGELRISDVHGSMQIDITNSEPSSVRIIVLSDVQFEPIQMPGA